MTFSTRGHVVLLQTIPLADAAILDDTHRVAFHTLNHVRDVLRIINNIQGLTNFLKPKNFVLVKLDLQTAPNHSIHVLTASAAICKMLRNVRSSAAQSLRTKGLWFCSGRSGSHSCRVSRKVGSKL